MGKNKKSLSSKVVTVFNPENDEEFEGKRRHGRWRQTSQAPQRAYKINQIP